jgi:hypothetical protein
MADVCCQHKLSCFLARRRPGFPCLLVPEGIYVDTAALGGVTTVCFFSVYLSVKYVNNSCDSITSVSLEVTQASVIYSINLVNRLLVVLK